MRWTECAPRDVALEMLRARFAMTPSSLAVGTPPELTSFQALAVQRLRVILERRRGAVLADSVGLGKTHIARAIIRDVMRADGHVLVCGPAALRSHWRRHLRDVSAWEWLSHTALSRGATSPTRPELVVVDEAHAFRNPATRRYHRLAALCGDAHLLLLTATPVNNSIMDFYHLLRLFSARHDFADVGVTDLLTAVETAGTDSGPLRRVIEAVVVRRTRDLIERFAPLSAEPPTGTSVLRFPRREPVRLLSYDLASSYPGLIIQLASALGALRFPAHAQRENTGQGVAGASELMRLTLLKRLESSPAAFAASLNNYVRMLRHFLVAGEQRLWLDVRRDRGLYRDVDGAVQLVLDRVALPPWPESLDSKRVLSGAQRELETATELLHLLGATHVFIDAKLQRLGELLDSDLRDDQVLVFTEFRETARMLWRHLVARGGVALIHGGEARLGEARAGRGTVIRRFAPLSNGLPSPRARERVRILIATDVLAEGLNLQDARIVISYDVPWNPVRLAQRIGRIDRLGSPHESVTAYAFRPDRHVDALLGLVRRVRRKLRDIRVVGGDAPLLGSRGAADNSRHSGERPGTIGGDWSTSERLRLAYTALAATGAAGAAGAAAGVPVADNRRAHSVPVAAVTCAVGGRAALVTLQAGAAVYSAAVYGRGAQHGPAFMGGKTVEFDTEAVDALLLTVLDSPCEPAPLDLEWLSRAVQAARRALRTGATGSPGARKRGGAMPADPAFRHVARALGRWLASRPGGATAEEAGEADKVLATLNRCGAAMAIEVEQLARAGLDDDELVTRLRSLTDAATPPRPADRHLHGKAAPVGVIAAIELRPRDAN